MAYQQRGGSGTLFRKPYARYEALIDGILDEEGTWTKEGRGGKLQSVSFKRKEAR
jgi:hypothetical protein